MHDLDFVRQRVAAGDKVRFFEDFYGKQWVVVKRGWLFSRRRIYLKNDEIFEVKTALRQRRRMQASPPPRLQSA